MSLDYSVSTLILYKRCLIIPEKRFIVEDIDSYLATLTKETISNFQYIKHALMLEIKINKSQVWQEFESTNDFNYCSIQNSDSTKIVYYFIKKKVMRANSTILLELEMDVLNTFKWNVDYSVSPRTCVLREHKDRWKSDGDTPAKYYPIIDFFSEGIQVPLYKDNDYVLHDSRVDRTWYLIYKNRTTPTEDNPTPIDCFLVPDETVNAKVSDTTIIDTSMLDNGYIYILATQFVAGTSITIKYTGGSMTISPYTPTSYQVFALELFGGGIKVKKFQYSFSLGVWNHTLLEEFTVAYLEVIGNFGSSIATEKTLTVPDSINEGDDNDTIDFGDNIVSLATINDIDKTDVLLNKIIAIPYFPTSFTMTGSNMVIPSEWEYITEDRVLKLKNLNTKFKCKVLSDGDNPIKLILGTGYSKASLEADDRFEDPKRFHSDFFQQKFVYDSFSYTFKLEAYDINDYISSVASIPSELEFVFVMTNTINSKFLFDLHQNSPDRTYIQEDFEDILCVARNNEVVIYNSPYLNYLRVSYNYDLKAKERSVFTTELGAGLGITGQLLGVGLGVASGNPAVAVQSALSGATGIVSSLVNSIMAVSQAEENFARKQDEMKTQAVSVLGADDLDLLEYYSGNRARYMLYRVSNKVQTLLEQLFYYTGYNTNEFKIPSVQTRRYFNFLQCELKINHYINDSGTNRGGVNIPDDCLQEIINLFSIGATFIHHYNSTWDLNQTSNNLERSVL